MADFSSRVIALSRAAWSLREAAPKPSALPFALALFSDASRMDPIDEIAVQLPTDIPPVAVIFRHDHLPEAERMALAQHVMTCVQERGHLFLMARAEMRGANGHHAFPSGSGLKTMPVHNEDEVIEAVAEGADALFLSPINGTASHPDQKPLSRGRAVALAQACPVPIFALGGMDEHSAEALEGTPFQGFGAIGAFAG
ncbi:MAG: thiamine phosphate synthase [Pseudomonadota bacterium]